MVKRKLKKNKMRFPVSKVVMLASVLVAFCIILLAVSILFPVKKSGGQEHDDTVKEPTEVPEDRTRAEKQLTDGNSTAEQKKKPVIPDTTVPSAPKTSGTGKTKPPVARPEKTDTHTPHPDGSRKEKPPVSEKKGIPSVRSGTPAARVPETVPEYSITIPAAVNSPALVFVFDDGGQNLSQLDKVLALPFPVTVAVLPGLVHSVDGAARVRKSGKELILHQPMQALDSDLPPGPGAVTPDMHVYDIERIVRNNIAEIGPVAGLNNHEGSKIMENEVQAGAVLDVAIAAKIYFLDSRTTAETRAPQAALTRGISIYSRDIFLDNVKTKENVLAEIQKGLAIANRKGYSIMIGHVWSADLIPPLLMQLYPELVGKGYRFTTVSASGALQKEHANH